MGTTKQQKLLKLLMENYGTEGVTKSLGELMREAGYSEASCKNPKLILESDFFQEGLDSVVSDLEQLRKNALSELKARNLSDENYKEIVKALDTFTKNHQLLTGGDTERSTKPLVVKIIGEDGNDYTERIQETTE